jgi:hypothetical protein
MKKDRPIGLCGPTNNTIYVRLYYNSAKAPIATLHNYHYVHVFRLTQPVFTVMFSDATCFDQADHRQVFFT